MPAVAAPPMRLVLPRHARRKENPWLSMPMPKPMQLVGVSRDLEGRSMYLLPPNPTGNPYRMLSVYDWPKHEDLWQAFRGSIMGLVPDGRALIEGNYRANKGLGFKKDWKELWGREEGKTCILVSCGPSLADSADEIKELARKPDHFTLGLNRALRAMPLDYYFAIDRRAASDGSGVCDWVDRDPGRTKIIASTMVCSDVPRRFPEAQRYWGDHHVTAEDSGLSGLSTHMVITLCDAMMLAYKLGAKKVLLYGCDFSVSGSVGRDEKGPHWVLNNFYHDMDAAKGMEIRAGLFGPPIPMRGINDKMTYVTWELICWAAYTTCMAMMLTKAGVRVQNKTPQGVLWEEW